MAQWLWYILRLCTSTQLLSLKVTLISGSVGHYMVSVLDGHSPPLFRLRVLKWVISVTFGLFGLSWWNIHRMGCCCKSFALNLSLSGHCLPSLASVAQGTLYFVPWWTLLCVPWWTFFYCGSLPCRSLLYLWGMIWTSGGHHSSLSISCWAVCGWGRISAGPSPFLKQNLRHLLVLCHHLFFLPWSNHQRSWNELYQFYV